MWTHTIHLPSITACEGQDQFHSPQSIPGSPDKPRSQGTREDYHPNTVQALTGDQRMGKAMRASLDPQARVAGPGFHFLVSQQPWGQMKFLEHSDVHAE